MKTRPRQLECLESRQLLTAAYYGFGDFDGDHVFDSDDLLQAFAAGKYETDEVATFEEGDINNDQRFDSDDLLQMFAGGFWGQDERTAHVETMTIFIKNRLRGDPPPGQPLTPNETPFDHNGDNTITMADLDAYMALQGTVNGDIDFDGEINTEIFTDPESRWRRVYESGHVSDGLRWIHGDFDVNGGANLHDLDIAGVTL